MYVSKLTVSSFDFVVCRFVGLGEDPQVLAIRAPELFGVGVQLSLYNRSLIRLYS